MAPHRATSASAGSRSGTTSTRPPSATTPSASRRWPPTPRWPATRRGCAAARSSTPSATAIRRCWPTPSAPSTSCRAAGPTSVSAPAGARSSTTPTASRSRRSKVRMDQLEEAIQCVRGLLREDASTSRASGSSSHDAQCVPKPVQPELPIWVGRRRREAHAAHRRAVGRRLEHPLRRAPRPSPTSVGVLHRHCDAVGRDPAEIRTAVNVGLAWTEESLRQQFGGLADYVRPGVLTGTDAEVIDRIGAYVEAGAEQVNLALRAPFDEEALDRFAEALGLTRVTGASPGPPGGSTSSATTPTTPAASCCRWPSTGGPRCAACGGDGEVRLRSAAEPDPVAVDLPVDRLRRAAVGPVRRRRRRRAGRRRSRPRRHRRDDRADRRRPVVERGAGGGRRPRPRLRR